MNAVIIACHANPGRGIPRRSCGNRFVGTDTQTAREVIAEARAAGWRCGREGNVCPRCHDQYAREA